MDLFPHQFIADFTRWPKALPESAVTRTFADRQKRATAVVDLLLPPDLAGKTVLDFGCGDALVAAEVACRGGTVTAYDRDRLVVRQQLGVTITEKPSGTFDLVLLLDVLDHSTEEPPGEVLARAASLLAPDGLMVVRCHPYISRHGGHHAAKVNAAFAHLITDLPHTAGVLLPDPALAYRHWITSARLSIRSHVPVRDPIEPFFARHFPREVEPYTFCNQSFHDFVLRR